MVFVGDLRKEIAMRRILICAALGLAALLLPGCKETEEADEHIGDDVGETDYERRERVAQHQPKYQHGASQQERHRSEVGELSLDENQPRTVKAPAPTPKVETPRAPTSRVPVQTAPVAQAPVRSVPAPLPAEPRVVAKPAPKSAPSAIKVNAHTNTVGEMEIE
jgi:predicted small secreted protein